MVSSSIKTHSKELKYCGYKVQVELEYTNQDHYTDYKVTDFGKFPEGRLWLLRSRIKKDIYTKELAPCGPRSNDELFEDY